MRDFQDRSHWLAYVLAVRNPFQLAAWAFLVTAAVCLAAMPNDRLIEILRRDMLWLVAMFDAVFVAILALAAVAVRHFGRCDAAAEGQRRPARQAGPLVRGERIG